VTDGDTHPAKEGYAIFWQVVDQAVTGMGFPSLWSKFHLPLWLLYPAAHACDWIGWAIGRKLKLNPFNVRVLTMHRWFKITAAEKDLKFTPIVSFADGWPDAIQWFKVPLTLTAVQTKTKTKTTHFAACLVGKLAAQVPAHERCGRYFRPVAAQD
jgi:hypothetical protein